MTEADAFDPEAFGLGGDPIADLELADREQTVALGRAIGAYVREGDLVGLIGPLGSGKTTLVGGIADRLGATRPATSPTYTLVNRYETQPPLIHIDLYRLESVDDLETTGYWDFLRAGSFVVCVEWLGRVPAAWPGEGLVVRLAHRPEGRAAQIWATEERLERAEAIVEAFGGRQ